MKNKILILSGILLIFFIAVLATNNIYWLDFTVYTLLKNIMNPVTTNIFKAITVLGSFGIIIITVILCFTIKNKKIVATVLINLAMVLILNQSIKYIIQRDRPVENQMILATGYSFPSGHTMTSIAFYGYLTYLIHTFSKNKKIKIASYIFFSLLILLIATSRIYLGVHYASDILAGVIITLIYLDIYIYSLEKINFIKNKKKK